MLISSESLEKYDANSIVDNKTKLNEDVEYTCFIVEFLASTNDEAEYSPRVVVYRKNIKL
ncbi:hypothetical protein ACU8KH_01766 [Lachancea thermotolerans]